MSKLPTVKIDDGAGGSIVINESDYDPKAHKLADEKPKRGRKPSKQADGE